ncbi:hypothetical protein PUNSTDRAFT_134471 [Punctularia strigosozonata HHB-11173 SS5]|uniref:uncharacterized protein n=1 Tax=Punctularia strigosozonata (strain HHB-11173) TaxID=741275 RepID=UPI0004418372|nr:uncharacterized protein PUNSTDRAFT_134471 [Punctularia strigosozonata HHB-11173 SS5]EIN09318.1 hypothetical protein PUNSTDRAFT_134471 [Punctularia strigosozonata HHB-11173 SS5]
MTWQKTTDPRKYLFEVNQCRLGIDVAIFLVLLLKEMFPASQGLSMVYHRYPWQSWERPPGKEDDYWCMYLPLQATPDTESTSVARGLWAYSPASTPAPLGPHGISILFSRLKAKRCTCASAHSSSESPQSYMFWVTVIITLHCFRAPVQVITRRASRYWMLSAPAIPRYVSNTENKGLISSAILLRNVPITGLIGLQSPPPPSSTAVVKGVQHCDLRYWAAQSSI